MKKKEIDLKIGLAKHGLNIKKVDKTTNLIFGFVKARALCRRKEGERREEEKKKKEERKKRRRRKARYGNYLCKETIVRMLVWNCLETLVLEFLFPYGFVY